MAIKNCPFSYEELKEMKRKLGREKPTQWLKGFENIAPYVNNLGFDSVKSFITTPVNDGGLGMSADKFMRLLTFNDAYDIDAKEIVETYDLSDFAKSVEVLGENGVHSFDKNENVKAHDGGNSNTYRIAKLKRDHPKVAQRLIDGEFKSVSEAERAAGLARPLLSALDRVQRAYDKLSDEDKKLFNR